MGYNLYKVEYECDCGIDYGSCGAKCAIILKSNRSSDIHTIYHTDGHSYHTMPITQEGGLINFGDNYLNALDKLIQMKDSNPFTLTESEKLVVK